MATLAAGALDRGNNVAMMGTSTCWGIIHAGEGFAKELVSMPHVANSTEQVYTWAGSATSGALVRWFRDMLSQSEVKEAAGARKDPLELLDGAAALVPPGCEGLLALPYFMGERAPLWDPQARGAWFGLTLSHTKAHLFRALLEATAFALRHAIEEGKNIGLPLEEETIVVGGVANSDLWLSILADVTGRPIRTLATQGIGAPLADAFLVGLASGIVSDCRQIREWLSYTEPILPDSGRHAIYDRYYALYRSLYEAVCPKLRELSELSEEEQ